MSFPLILALLSITLRDINGVERKPLEVGNAKANVLFFVTNDCPISNAFAHEMARICAEYGSRGVTCELVYVDPALSDAQVREHASSYGHGDYPRVIDRRHALVKAVGATVTPEAAVVVAHGELAYLGRIDDSIGALAQPHRPAQNHDLRDALDAILAGQPVAHARTKALGCYISDLAPKPTK